jgi:hypothetical protein
MPTYTINDGDCMNTIAQTYGFFWSTIWNHTENAALVKLRNDPNVLLPGDQVFIPDKEPKEESGATGQVHTFRLKGVPVKLIFQLLDFDGSPRAGEPYTLDVDGTVKSAVTGSDGVISMVIPPNAKKAKITITETQEEYDFDLGYMNPVSDPKGLQARLQNLGFLKGDITGTIDDQTKQAIRRFQEAKNLKVTGEADQATQDALLAAHEG